MQFHGNAKLGLAGRHALVMLVEQGCSIREAARRHGVSPTTACRWSRRWRAATSEERSSLVCLCDRSSRPRRSPRLLAVCVQERIVLERRRSGAGPRRIAARLGYPHQTVWKVLKRAGCSCPEKTPRQTGCRYERSTAGELLHMDWTTLARFDEPGRHQLTGIVKRPHANKKAKVGKEVVHAIIDDHSRLAYVEVLPDSKAETVTAFVTRAFGFYRAHGIRPQRLMTDNAWSYTLNKTLRRLLVSNKIGHLTTRPNRPCTNGKVERFIQTLQREWAYQRVYTSSRARNEALPYWLHHYNRSRPHTALDNRPPISRCPQPL
jgi:transposase InsO family protein